ncbi:hypothetical protein ACLB2K_050905 [Fragaria x ananassa]
MLMCWLTLFMQGISLTSISPTNRGPVVDANCGATNSAMQVSDSSCAIMFFDGAVDKLGGRGGLGAAMLSAKRGLLGALSIPLPFSLSPLATEPLALWHGLKYCKRLGIQKVEVRGDALDVLNGLKHRHRYRRPALKYSDRRRR